MSKRLIKNYIEQGNDFRSSLVGQSDVIMAVANAIIQSIKNGGKLIIFGNGGSAADAQHISSEFVSGYFSGGRPLPAIALTPTRLPSPPSPTIPATKIFLPVNCSPSPAKAMSLSASAPAAVPPTS